MSHPSASAGTPGDEKPWSVTQALDAWDQVLVRMRRLVRDERIDAAWVTRLTALAASARHLVTRDPDIALYVLIEAAGSQVEHYSAQHGLTCLAIAHLAAGWMEWPDSDQEALALSALSMNISVTDMQDTLAKQSTSLTAVQRERLASHANDSASLLASAGVTNPLWLHIVGHHHAVPETGAELGTDPCVRLTELLRRVDIYAAKLSRRGSRQSVTPAMAARDACLDTGGRPDAIGGTLLRVVGLYPPGTFVELVNGEIGVAIARGAKAHTPIVASVRRRDGGLLMQPLRRDTQRLGFGVKHGVEPSRVRVLLNHRRILSSGE